MGIPKENEVIISKGNTKLGDIHNVSLSPISGCGNCFYCHKDCYALKAYRLHPSVKRAWDNNLRLAQSDLPGYFSSINGQLKLNVRFFRWHVAGDILSQVYLEYMFSLARCNEHVQFLAFTKMYYLDYERLSEIDNLNIILSAWPGLELYNPYNLPVAYMQDGNENRIPMDAVVCRKKCDECFNCWNMGPGDSIVLMKH